MVDDLRPSGSSEIRVVQLVHGEGGLDPANDNVDVEVTLADGSRWTATFFTPSNIASLMEGYKHSGECMRGLYFWAQNAIVIRTLNRESIEAAVADLLVAGEFRRAFGEVEGSG